MTIQDRTITIVEFWEIIAELPDDKLYELVDGEMVEVAPPKRKNSWLAMEIGSLIRNHAREKDLGVVLGADGGFNLTETQTRVPDASFVAKARVDAMNTAEDNNAIFAPDLAVEIISPSETPRSVNDKTMLYLNAGTQQVWNVYLDEQVIEVWQKNAAGKFEFEAFEKSMTITGGDTLPEFSLPLADLFGNMPA